MLLPLPEVVQLAKEQLYEHVSQVSVRTNRPVASHFSPEHGPSRWPLL